MKKGGRKMSMSRAIKNLAVRSSEAAEADPSVLRMLLSITIKGYAGLVLAVILGSASIRGRVAGFLADAWAVILGFSSEEMLKVVSFWLMSNLLLFVIVSVWITWKYVWSASKDQLNDDTDVPMSVTKWFLMAVFSGPRLASQWLKDGFVMDMLVTQKFATRTEKVDAIRKISTVLNTYEDMKCGVATNRLTILVYAMGVIGAIVWGLYPFIHAIKQNIIVTSEMFMRESDIMAGIKAIRKPGPVQ